MTSLPPGPRSPAVWQLLHYTHSPLPFLDSCARRFGEAFTLRLAGYGTFVMLSAAEAIKDVFHGDPSVLHSGEGNEFLTLTVGQSSVLVLDDEPHARQRHLLLPLLKGERMRSFFGAMQAATLEQVRRWPLNEPVNMVEPMQQITLRVILQAVLGLAPGPRLEDIERKVGEILVQGRGRYGLLLVPLVPAWVLKHPSWLPYFREMAILDQALFTFFDEERRKPAPARGENVLSDLLAVVSGDGQPLSNREIRDIVVTLLFAGHDTTALALAWTLEQVVPREDIIERLRAEVRGTSGGLPQADQLPRLEYLDAVIRESLRCRTILPFVVRKTKRAFVAGGREYPPDVLLCPSNHLVHHRADLYPDPEQFRPERFLEHHYAGHEWFPFGGPNRTCLGMAFALYEMKVVLSTLFSQVRLARPAGSSSWPVRRGISLAPHDGARMMVTERLGAGAGELS